MVLECYLISILVWRAAYAAYSACLANKQERNVDRKRLETRPPEIVLFLPFDQGETTRRAYLESRYGTGERSRGRSIRWTSKRVLSLFRPGYGNRSSSVRALEKNSITPRMNHWQVLNETVYCTTGRAPTRPPWKPIGEQTMISCVHKTGLAWWLAGYTVRTTGPIYF